MDVAEFRKQVKFDDAGTDDATRAKLLLFWVTKLSRLRDDMKPDVMSERLRDWGYENVSPGYIESAFTADRDVMNSISRAGAFCITQQAEYRIKKTLKTSGEMMFRQTIIVGMVAAASIFTLILLGIIAYSLVTDRKGVHDYSWPELREKTGFDLPGTDEAQKAKYLLFFITEVTRLKPDMTAKAIADRLVDIGYTKSDARLIKQAFAKDNGVIVSALDPNAYQLNPLTVSNYAEKLELKRPALDHLTLDWLSEHVPWLGWTAILSVYFGSMALFFLGGYRLALHAPAR